MTPPAHPPDELDADPIVPSSPPGHRMPFGSSDMAERVLAHDWAATPLGPLDQWPDTLRSAAGLCLHSRFPTALWWGPELIALYNDAYAEYLGPDKHPAALGRPYREVWSEIWPMVEDLFTGLLEEGAATWREHQQLVVERQGRREEAFFTYDLSPVMDGDGTVVGALNVAVETTRMVHSNRRMAVLQAAGTAAGGARTVADAGAAITLELARHTQDVPFSVLYHVDDDDRATLIGSAHLAPDSPAAPSEVELGAGPWPLGSVLATGRAVHLQGLAGEGPRRRPPLDDVPDPDALGPLPGGPWPEPAREALVIPLERGDFRAVLVAGVSPRVPLDDDYRGFLTSLGEVVGTALADVAAQMGERAARMEAEKANRAKSEFLAAMSHELRTPLNAIGGYVDLLDAGVYGDVTEAQVGALERVSANQRHLLALINDILLFARIEAAQLRFERQVLEASELIESLEALIHPQALGKQIDYTIGPCPETLHLLGDRERIRQILLNLVGNAIKFTPRGGRVTVTCRASEDGQCVLFDVEDTGPGIPADRRQEVFDPFSQVERRLDRPKEGAGLGLSISRDMARAMDGDVTLVSEPGEGATFRLSLPAADPPADPPADPAP